jgi:hypothetical protein
MPLPPTAPYVVYVHKIATCWVGVCVLRNPSALSRTLASNSASFGSERYESLSYTSNTTAPISNPTHVFGVEALSDVAVVVAVDVSVNPSVSHDFFEPVPLTSKF